MGHAYLDLRCTTAQNILLVTLWTANVFYWVTTVHHISLQQIHPRTQWLTYESKSKCLSSALSKANVRWLSRQHEAYCFSTQIQLAHLFHYSYFFLNTEPPGWRCAKQRYNKHGQRYTPLRTPVIATCLLKSWCICKGDMFYVQHTHHLALECSQKFRICFSHARGASKTSRLPITPLLPTVQFLRNQFLSIKY